VSRPHPDAAAVLLPGKDKPVRNRHPWIFSGAIGSLPEFENGGILPVLAADGEFLGHAYFNRETSIAGRMLNFDRTPPLEALGANIDTALALRRGFFGPETTACRLVNGEGDGLPGLVADIYGDVLVLQISTLGMDRLKPFILDRLTQRLAPRAVYEKSHLPTRREEGLPMFDGPLRGEAPGTIEILENGLRFRVDIVHGQKTGFYLDQREMRAFARRLASGRRVLNAFAYTGGFSVFAFAGGAVRVDSVETSDRATALGRENCALNGFGERPGRFLAADVFEFIRADPLEYDLIVLDPPAFAKKKTEVIQACRGYKDIHRIVFQKVPAGGLVLTFSCSFFVDETLFRQVLFQAAREASRGVRILQGHHQAFDHPVNIYHPESDYLKGFLLEVE
jgi:23S rRNA (cytosine1962-C5)-methyltransferase